MAGRLSFSIAVNLLTENFKKGASSVSSSLKSMQMQVLTFAAAIGGVGLGLNDFVSNLINTARETGRVTTALKNVSGSTLQYADNQRFLLSMAKKYGSEINALTNAYAKFTAAASTAGMSVKDQQKIFESVSRATTAFGLSADDSNAVFLALSQMMSKGKISAEELRGQMGERLPIAFQAMAKAAGTSVEGLDKLMKAGSVMSSDVLPKFADALNEMIPSVNTDNIETSINRLKNAFTEFTKGTGVQAAFKKVVDGIVKAVEYAGANVKSIISSVSSFIVGVALGKLFKWIIAQLAIAQKAAMMAAIKASQAAGQQFDRAAWRAKSGAATMSMAFSRAAAAIKTAMMSAIPTAILVIVSELIGRMVYLNQEAKRIKSIFSDYKNEANRATNNVETSKLETLYKIATDTNRALASRQYALNEINKQLGTSYSIDSKTLSIQGDINEKYQERLKLIKAAAEVDFYTTKKLETEDKIKSLQAESIKAGAMDLGGKRNPWAGPLGVKTLWNMFSPWGSGNKIQSNNEEINQLQQVLSDATKKLEDAILIAPSSDGIVKQKVTPDEDKKKTELQKSEEKYKESLRELQAQLELNAQSGGKIGISQQEYNKAVDELRVKTLVDAKGTGDKELLTSKYLKTLEDAIKHPLYNETQDKLDQARKSYAEGLMALNNQRDTGAISEKTYRSELIKLIDETIKTTGAINGIGVEGLTFISSLQSTAASMAVLPKAKVRDTTYDYKKTRSDIAGEELGISKDNLDRILESMKPKLGELADNLNDALERADFNEALNIIKAIEGVDALKDSIDKVKGLDSVLKIETVRQDIKDLNKDLRETAYSGIKDMASSTDRMVSAFSSLSEAFSNTDTSAWERIMAIWNTITTSVDAALSVISTIEQITEIINKLAVAKEAEAAIDTATTATKVANAGTQAAAATAAAAAQTTAELTASSLKTTAATTEMAAKSTAAYAGIPFLGVGLAASQIATMQAMIAAAAIPKFENGGVVGGSSYHGDKILARVNSGELILNRQQQSTLFGLMNQNSISKSGDNKVIVRGSDLILSINNELKHRNKKPIL